MPIKNKLIVIIAVFIVFLSVFSSYGCKKKKPPPKPTPTPTNTEIPRMEKIVYTYDGVLLWMNPDGSGRESLFSSNNSKWYPSVSPDGWYIIYWASHRDYYNLHLADLKSMRTQQITFDEDSLEGDTVNFRINNAVAWSQDSSFVVYSRNKDVWKITKEGLNPEALTDTHDSISPTLSKDNKLIFVKMEKENTYNLYIKDLNSFNMQKLTKLIGKKAGSPQFSPDGTRVVYTVTDGDNVDVYMISLATFFEDQMTFDGKSHSPSFSHDGSKVIFSSYVNDRYQPDIWIMNLDKSEKLKITKDGGVSPTWLFRILAEPMATPVPEYVEPAATEAVFVQPTEPEGIDMAPTAEFVPPIEENLSVRLIKEGDRLKFYPVIYFDSGIANIKAEFYPVLDDMVKILERYNSPVVIEGHTDNTPINTKQFPDNQVLSEARARAVKKYLVSKGLLAKRLTINGFGDTIPVAPNDTAENKYRNRRSEIYIQIQPAEMAKADAEVATPTPAVTDTPVVIPTVVPTPKPKNIIEKLFKPKAKKGKAAGW